MTPLDAVDRVLAELAARRVAAVAATLDTLETFGPMPDPDPFTLSSLIDAKLDERLKVAAYLAQPWRARLRQRAMYGPNAAPEQ